MERDDWLCQRCKLDGKTLNIEHLFYYGAPWEIDQKWLITVCEDCHKYLEKIKYRRVEITDEFAERLYKIHLRLTDHGNHFKQ